MAVIWGLDLKEMQWRKFKGKYMWGNTYHKRRTKFIVYQLAMIFCVVSESLGTDLISKYLDERDRVVDGPNSGNHFSTSDLNGAFSYNIFVGIYVATIFGAAFFFDLFWPERRESAAVRTAWKICSLLTIAFTLSSAILLTVIITTHKAFFSGSFVGVITEPFTYKYGARAIASLVLIWLGFLASIWSTYLMWTCTTYIHNHGPFSRHVQKDLEAKGYPEMAHAPPGSTNPGEKVLNGTHNRGAEASPLRPHDHTAVPIDNHHRGTTTTPATNSLPQEAVAYMRMNDGSMAPVGRGHGLPTETRTSVTVYM